MADLGRVGVVAIAEFAGDLEVGEAKPRCCNGILSD